MDNTRRPFNRSLSKEPGLKKPRLNEDPAAPDRISNGRVGIFQRSAVSNSDLGAASRAQRDRDSEGSDPARGTYQLQPGQQELVTRYKTALSELTFNSKPIITNLTIIAGESMQAAKAIAATICVNILEVPRDQKLPSLYLLDSIVKNIGRDYIKYFASRLPEVFCKAYRQVDPSIHPGMRHLFGTWKGVFPPQALQVIEKELGFTTTLNGSSSATTSKPDSPAQRPAHSIHVNPKYLEARRLQTTRAMGAGNGNSESLVNSQEDVESVDMAPRISSGKSWADPYAKLHHLRDKIHEQVCDKNSRMVYSDSEHGSNVLGRSGLVTGRVAEKAKEPGYNKPRYTSSSDISGIMQKRNGFGLKHGFESNATDDPAISDSAPQLKKKTAIANSNGMSGDWKDTEEDDFVWKEMNTGSIVREMADASTIHHSTPDNYERLGFDSHLQRSQNLHDNVSRGDDEPLAGPNSMFLGPSQSIPQTQLPLWSHRSPPPPEGRMHSEMVKTLSSYSEDYSSGKSSQRTSWPMHSLSELGSSHVNLNFSTNMTPGPSTTQTRQAVGAMPSLMRPGLHQKPSSPLSAHGSKNNFPERNRLSTGLPMDSGYKNIGPSDHFSEDSLHLPQNIQSLPPVVQKRKHASARSLEVSGFESSGQVHSLLLPSQISGSESRSSMVKSSSDQSNPLTVDSPRKSITSNLFDAVGRSRMSKSSISGSSNEPSSQEARPGSTLKPLSAGVDEIPSAINSTSNPVSNLLSTLVSKGLIRSSKSGSSLPEPPRIPDLPVDKVSIITRSTPKTHVPRTDEPSSSEPAAGVAVNTPEGSPKIKNLIGFEFRPDVVRNLHPNVISEITDVPFECSICGLRLKLQERLERHMEWHATRDNDNNSRSWYPNLVNWVAGIYPPDASECADDVPEADVGPLVPADESQCACVLCGELFDDFYSRERDEWMFRGAIYLTDPSSSGDSPNPVVHVLCVTEDSLCDLGLAEDVESKLEARR